MTPKPQKSERMSWLGMPSRVVRDAMFNVKALVMIPISAVIGSITSKILNVNGTIVCVLVYISIIGLFWIQKKASEEEERNEIKN